MGEQLEELLFKSLQRSCFPIFSLAIVRFQTILRIPLRLFSELFVINEASARRLAGNFSYRNSKSAFCHFTIDDIVLAQRNPFDKSSRVQWWQIVFYPLVDDWMVRLTWNHDARPLQTSRQLTAPAVSIRDSMEFESTLISSPFKSSSQGQLIF